MALLVAVTHYRIAVPILIMTVAGAYFSVQRLGASGRKAIGNRDPKITQRNLSVNREPMKQFFAISLAVIGAFGGALYIHHIFDGRIEMTDWLQGVFPIIVSVQVGVALAMLYVRKAVVAIENVSLRELSLAVMAGVVTSCVVALTLEPPRGIESFFLVNGLVLNNFVLFLSLAYEQIWGRALSDVQVSSSSTKMDQGKVALWGEVLAGQDVKSAQVGWIEDVSLVGEVIKKMHVVGSTPETLRTLRANKGGALLVVLSERNESKHMRVSPGKRPGSRTNDLPKAGIQIP